MWHVACGRKNGTRKELVKDSTFQPLTQLKKAALSNLSSRRSSRSSSSISRISQQDAAALFHRAPRSPPDRVTVF